MRITTRNEARRAAIEDTGSECWIGTPDRLATLRGSLDSVAIACWMLACAGGREDELAALHGSRLEFFLGQAIDTTARGLIYDASPGRVPAQELARGERVFRSITELNAIPAFVLRAHDHEAWIAQADRAIASLLDPKPV